MAYTQLYAYSSSGHTLTKITARYGRVDLLCLDELGHLQLEGRGAELLFQVLSEREEKTAIAIASNEPFSGWTKTFTDPRLCATTVDRLTYDATIIQTGTASYHLAHTRAGGANSNRHPGARSGCQNHSSRARPASSSNCRLSPGGQ